MKHHLYRHFDADGRLLYVGISLSAVHRLSQHASHAVWFRSIADVQIAGFETRAEAEAAERRAIQEEGPLHNIAHTRKPGEARPGCAAPTITLETVWQLAGRKRKVLMWLVQQANAKNEVFATYAEIAAGAGVSQRTVGELLRILKGANIVTESRRTLWRLNPSVIFQGTHDRRMNVLIRYHDERGERATRQAETQPRNNPAL